VSKEARRIVLRREQRGPNKFSLWAYLDDDGNLHIDGQDLGPITASVSSDGEYEYFKTIPAPFVPELLALLGAAANTNPLDELDNNWCDAASWDLERVLAESTIPVKLHTYGG